jgi:hypothetical protein
VPLPTPGEEEHWIEAGQKQRNALGITSIRDLSNWPHAMRAFERMWRQGRLTVRVSLGLELAVSYPADLARQQMVTPGFGDHWLRIDSAGERPHPPEGDATLEEYKALMLDLNRLGCRDVDIHPVAVGHFVVFFLWFQRSTRWVSSRHRCGKSA